LNETLVVFRQGFFLFPSSFSIKKSAKFHHTFAPMILRFCFLLFAFKGGFLIAQGEHDSSFSHVNKLLLNGQYAEAQTLLYSIANDATKKNDCPKHAMALFKMGETYDQLKNIPLAISSLKEAASMAAGCNADSVEALSLRYLGGMYFPINTDSALHYLKLCYNKFEHTNSHRILSGASGMIANSYHAYLEDSAMAELWYAKSLHHALQSKDSTAIGYVYLRIGGFKSAFGNCPVGMPLMEESYRIFSRLKDTEGQLFALKGMASSYHYCNRDAEVFDILSEVIALQDELFKKETADKSALYRTLFETEKKEKENALKDKLIENEKQEKRQILFAFIGAFLLAALVFVFLYFRNQLKLKSESQRLLKAEQLLRIQNVVAAEEKERARIARELHDGVGHLISSAKMHVQAIEEVESENRELITQAEKILDEAAQEVRNIAHNLMPASLNELGLLPAIRELCRRLNKTLDVQVNLIASEEDLIIDNTSSAAVYRILQELLNNSLKHSKATKIEVEFIASLNHIKLVVTDNGVGFVPKSLPESAGIGWKNLQTRAEAINALLEVQSEKNQGTSVCLQFSI